MAIRVGGYFALVIALLSSINWLSTIREDYVMEHHWPAATAMIYSMSEESREVIPSSISTPHFWVYWAEFLVVLDLPRERCPGDMVPLNELPQCTGTVKTPEVRSRADAIRWFSRHPRESKVTVHYDTQSGRMVFGGESIFDVYPWHNISITGILLVGAVLMLGFARSRLADKSAAS